jgi:hypothetical protein
MSFQRIFSCEGFPAAAVAKEGLFPGVSFSMAFQIVLTVKG